MTKKKSSLLKKLIRISAYFRGKFYQPSYRLISIRKTGTDEYLATIQLIGKRVTFEMKPEEILSDDNLTDKFLPRDIRSLTYLGYLGINSPKYQILAQQLVNNEQIVFAIHKKGTKNIDLKTATQISQDKAIIENLPHEDIHTVVFTVAKESMQKEKIMKEIAEKTKIK